MSRPAPDSSRDLHWISRDPETLDPDQLARRAEALARLGEAMKNYDPAHPENGPALAAGFDQLLADLGRELLGPAAETRPPDLKKHRLPPSGS